MIAVAGEALIDLIEEDGVLRPFPGGGPFNTAVALGRLGVPVGFLGRLSDDAFGQLLEARLEESGVDRRYVLRGSAPTPLAVVHTGPDGDAEFAFYLVGTAYADLGPDDLPELGDEVDALHFGTLALATDPPASALELLMAREAPRRLVVVDPNVRAKVAGDAASYRRRFEAWAALAHVVKLSDADAAWLYPGEPPETAARRVLQAGASLAVVTLGPRGALAATPTATATAESPPVEVVDTVGAGDAFGAALLRRLWERDRLSAAGIRSLDADELEGALGFATAVAALQCARPGGVPPTLAEVDAFVSPSY